MNNSGQKNTSSGEDYGGEGGSEEEEKDPSGEKKKIAPLFKKSTIKDASFEDFKIITMLGKGTFGKVRKEKIYN
jgi:hypothetical protein